MLLPVRAQEMGAVAVAKEIVMVPQAMGLLVVVGVGVIVARRAEEMGAVAVAKATEVVLEAMGLVAMEMGVAVARRAEEIGRVAKAFLVVAGVAVVAVAAKEVAKVQQQQRMLMPRRVRRVMGAPLPNERNER